MILPVAAPALATGARSPTVAPAPRGPRRPVEAGNGGGGGGGNDTEPNFVCLAKLVKNFMEYGGGGEKMSAATAAKCGRNRRNCFNGNGSESLDDELDLADSPSGAELLKNLVQCASLMERNLLADAAKIVEKNKTSKRREDF